MKVTDRSDRFPNFISAVRGMVERFGLSQQQATHYVWDHQFTVGTDKGVWLDLTPAIRAQEDTTNA